MEKIGLRIKNAREAKGFTQTQLGEFLGYKKNTVSNWENGLSLPNGDVIRILCGLLGISADELLGVPSRDGMVIDQEERRMLRMYRRLDKYGKQHIFNVIDVELQRAERGDEDRRRGIISLRMYEQCASAGFGDYLSDSDSYEMIDVYDQPLTRKCDIVVRVNGDSMEPSISNRDLLLVKKQESISVGEMGVFVLNGESYVKELGRGCLISHNEKYKDIRIGEDDTIRCVGLVIGKLSPSELPR